MRFAQACAVALPTALLLVAGPAAAQGKRFDGNWSVEVVTQEGACDRAYRYAMVVENGVARYAGRRRSSFRRGCGRTAPSRAPSPAARTAPTSRAASPAAPAPASGR